jgi:2-polyprenyl-6-methoxyphenol hydroxylase-like FAD-dependent oxidoreductase
MSTTTSRTDCDVLVVGAGPTGLTLAAHLLARGVCTRIIDKEPGTPRLSRAIAIQPHTLETLDMMGIADRFLDVGHRVRGVGVYAGRRRLLGIDMAYSGSPFRFQLHLPQHHTETLLRDRVTELGGTVEAGVELAGFTHDGDAVTAALRDTAGHEQQVSAGFLVGCDGAHSRVRHTLEPSRESLRGRPRFLGKLPQGRSWLVCRGLAAPVRAPFRAGATACACAGGGYGGAPCQRPGMTWSSGSCGVIHGKMMNHSSAAVAMARMAVHTALLVVPPGRCRQSHGYMCCLLFVLPSRPECLIPGLE